MIEAVKGRSESPRGVPDVAGSRFLFDARPPAAPFGSSERNEVRELDNEADLNTRVAARDAREQKLLSGALPQSDASNWLTLRDLLEWRCGLHVPSTLAYVRPPLCNSLSRRVCSRPSSWQPVRWGVGEGQLTNGLLAGCVSVPFRCRIRSLSPWSLGGLDTGCDFRN